MATHLQKERRIGLFGGSFNPIHKAHVALADTICKAAALDEVWFLVSPHNPLKQAGTLMDDALRYEMVLAALEKHPHLVASDYEFKLEKPSFTWKTLEHLEQDYPYCEFSLIIGADNWVLFPRWAHHEYILNNHQIYIYPRRDCEISAAELPSNVHIIDTPMFDISSTQIREMYAQGKDISQWVDSKVIDILNNYHLK